ncbi:putative glycoside hydrolase [Paenibacillus sp. GP183]|uniref:putative glycoside hydrolase n=1 Tax=Paenibacillus sp. GP183 TaxID=1882751 RepID=UPI000894ECC3|nr:putative glycoside hydrolase [Paenibacillus sp. GP183]SEC31380.1 hypothetical protein SAMN05443246_3678 [Paenibacillus sp. GP183]
MRLKPNNTAKHWVRSSTNREAAFLTMLVFAILSLVLSGCTAQNKADYKPPLPSSMDLPNRPASTLTKATPAQILVKGIYVSAHSLHSEKFNQLLHLVDTTDLNAMVIDLKTDSGQVTYPSIVPLVKEIGANSNLLIPDLKEKLKLLKSKQIYTIARVVVFKDPYLSNRKNNFAIRSKSGAVWRDNKGVSWVDPYKEKVWDYNIDIAQEAAEMGFDEIQFDYVRFPENGRKMDEEVHFEQTHGWSKAQVIEAFLKRAKSQIGTKAIVSVDVFGLTTSSQQDMGIGQEWSLISKEVDVISPMLYPSHYSKGIYGIANPDLQPYLVINRAVADARKKNEQLLQSKQSAARIRPWFQDFTATWVYPHKNYGLLDVKEQIKAAHEQGIDEFLLWNSHCTYSYR